MCEGLASRFRQKGDIKNVVPPTHAFLIRTERSPFAGHESLLGNRTCHDMTLDCKRQASNEHEWETNDCSLLLSVVMVLFFRASLFTLLLASIRYIYAIAPDYPLRECKTNRRRKVARRELFKEEKVNEKIERIVKSKEWGVKR